MPAYDFKCPEGHVCEAIFAMTEVPTVIPCPLCNGAARRKYTPPAAIHFKGGGFYETDVRSKLHRKRRPNPGDDLPVEYDHAAAAIADAI